MDNEIKWEYDYTTSNSKAAGDSGYPNVGSSGLNTANQYANRESGESAAPQSPSVNRTAAGAGGGNVPPMPPQEYGEMPVQSPNHGRNIDGGKVARSVLALVLAAAVGFGGGIAGSYVGSKYLGNGKVVIQQVTRAESADSTGDSGVVSTTSSGSSLTTEQVADMVSPSVVVITTEQVVYSQWSWYGQSQVESGAGSGVIISSDGYILTCAHVVDGATSITVTIDDTDYNATLIGEDTTSDVAVIKIEAANLTPATVGDSSSLKVGQSVIAVGNPLGELGGTVTGGMISALNRSVSIQGTNSVNTMSLIQMDASVSPGNSGGGLFNMNGELIGIVNAKSSSSDAEGLGFAIPINDAISVAKDLMENGYVTGRPYLGITYMAVTDSQTAQQLGVSAYGIYVVSVTSGSPADKAGLKAGDRIVSMDGTEIAQKSDLGTLMQEYSAGDSVTMTIARNGQMQEIHVTLGEKNNETATQTTEEAQNSDGAEESGNNRMPNNN